MCPMWQARQGSNLRPQVLETCALPAELRAYGQTMVEGMIEDRALLISCASLPLGGAAELRTYDYVHFTGFPTGAHCYFWTGSLVERSRAC